VELKSEEKRCYSSLLLYQKCTKCPGWKKFFCARRGGFLQKANEYKHLRTKGHLAKK
jgi:hypothetical protein